MSSLKTCALWSGFLILPPRMQLPLQLGSDSSTLPPKWWVEQRHRTTDLHKSTSFRMTQGDQNASFMNIASDDLTVTEANFHGTHEDSQTFCIRLFKVCFRQQEKEISVVEKGVDVLRFTKLSRRIQEQGTHVFDTLSLVEHS